MLSFCLLRPLNCKETAVEQQFALLCPGLVWSGLLQLCLVVIAEKRESVSESAAVHTRSFDLHTHKIHKIHCRKTEKIKKLNLKRTPRQYTQNKQPPSTSNSTTQRNSTQHSRVPSSPAHSTHVHPSLFTAAFLFPACSAILPTHLFPFVVGWLSL